MAVLKIYSIYDAKVEAYMRPFFQQTKNQALRTWVDLCNDASHEIHKHSEDYTLFELGEFDDKTGKIIDHATPMSLGIAKEYVRAEA